MKRFLAVLLLCWSWAAWSQPVLRNSYTTNSTGRTPNVLPTSVNPLFPLSVENPTGVGADRAISYTPGFSLTGTNMTIPGNLSLNGRTNRLSIANDTLLLDGVSISGSSESAPVTNFYATTINVTTQNFTVGKGGSLTITNNVLFPWTTLTLTGTNVSQMNLTNTAFKLTLTANGFIGTPTGFPSSNLLHTFQLHVLQDATGSRSLTITNGTFIMAGSGTSTNAVASLNTNAGAVTVLTFASSPFDSSKIHGVVTALGQ